MKILLINRFFDDKSAPTARMLSDLVHVLENRGHETVILTSSTNYAREDKTVEEGSIIRIRLWKGFPRILHWVCFLMAVSAMVPFLKWDKCVLMTDPPFMTLAAAIDRLFFRKREFYLWLMDLYPNALSSSGILKSRSILYRILASINKHTFGLLAGIICLGDRMRELVKEYGIQPGNARCIMVPPWDKREFVPIERSENRFIRSRQLSDKRIALYAGNLGEAHTYRNIIETAALMQNDARFNDWVFVFIVRGALVQSLRESVENCSNVLIEDYLPHDEFDEAIVSADVHLITMSEKWDGIVVPSKLYGILKTEKPVLFVGPKKADTALEIVKHGIGHVLENGVPPEKIAEVLTLMVETDTPGERFDTVSGEQVIANFIESDQ